MEGNSESEDGNQLVEIGSLKVPIRLVRDSAEEILFLWSLQQPTLSKQNALVGQSSLRLNLEACGQRVIISQSPSSMTTPGVTGAVMWDSGIVLAKFLEHAVDSGFLLLQTKKIVELGSGCGLAGCIAALLGAQVILTDLPDRLKLLRKNVEANINAGGRGTHGSASVRELTWGDYPDLDLIDPPPDYVIASDVIYSEGAVTDLLETLKQLCGMQTTVILTGELRNDVVLECFLELAMKDFTLGRVYQEHWDPDYRSSRVVMLVLVKKSQEVVVES
ncbi:hypothetical protein AQUCO_00400803v1 [Aquilegia coerulea]|uniref:Uncharacterized protein n=1 Tax=Aquilegia coerulea TaxID=218851 RepID=A0A2G5EWL1_AQUCA|nr:hypothetical protein AQUCO_00400803v1 [Aquilegia coerulea]